MRLNTVLVKRFHDSIATLLFLASEKARVPWHPLSEFSFRSFGFWHILENYLV